MNLVRESIYLKDTTYFKGPSRDRIEKFVVGLSLEEKFQVAIKNSCIWLVKQCLDDGVDPSDYDNWAIWMAAKCGHLEIVRFLLADSRVDPSDYDNRAILWAMNNDHIDVVKELLKNKRVRDKLQI